MRHGAASGVGQINFLEKQCGSLCCPLPDAAFLKISGAKLELFFIV